MGLPSHMNGSFIPTPEDLSKKTLREWWFNLLRHYGKFPIYSIYLTLPMDLAVINYLKASGNELNSISEKNCLILALASSATGIYGDKTSFLDGSSSKQDNEYKEFKWNSSVDEQTSKGISLQISKLFGIKLKELPCMIFFKDIRVSEYILISLKGFNIEEITQKMRIIFAVIDEAVTHHEDPLEMLVKHKNNEKFIRAGKSMISGIKTISKVTLEIAIRAFMETKLKP